MEARRSFDSVAAVYERIRPSYPPALFDDLFTVLPQDPRVLEVGPGPGKATRDLLERGAQVHAIEIGPALAETLRGSVASDQLTVEVGDFEEVPIDAAAFDCVFAASAYHWINLRAQLDRPAVLLRTDGVLAVVDLIQVDSSNDRGFFAAAQPIYARHGQGHVGPPAPRRNAVEPAIHLALNDDDRFTAVQVRQYDWDQTYTAAEYRLLMESYSVTQMMSRSDRRALLDDMESFVRDRFDNEVVRPLVVTLTTARFTTSTKRQIWRADGNETPSSSVRQIARSAPAHDAPGGGVLCGSPVARRSSGLPGLLAAGCGRTGAEVTESPLGTVAS